MPMNMEYCRFENTYRALRECEEFLTDQDDLNKLSASEQRYAKLLFKLCLQLGEDFDGMI